MADNTETFNELCRFQPPVASRTLMWELTDHCNLACAHCCTESSPSVSRAHDTPYERIVEAIRQFSAAGVSEVAFTGGEAMVRRDFVDIITEACAQRVRVSIATNGTMLTEQSVERLKGLDISLITVSLDGHTAELHNELRRNGSAFQRAIRGISLCVDAGIPIRVSHMITPRTCKEIEAFCKFIAVLGVRHIVLHSIVPVGRAAEEQHTLMDRGVEEDVTATVVRLQRQYEGSIRIDHSLETGRSSAPIGCPAGARLLHIAADGSVSVCSWLFKLNRPRFTLGNIKTHSLLDCAVRWEQVMHGLPELDKSCPIPWVNTHARSTALSHIKVTRA